MSNSNKEPKYYRHEQCNQISKEGIRNELLQERIDMINVNLIKS